MEKKTRYFDMARKIVATMTTDSWREIPHCAAVYEADAGKLLKVLKEYNSSHAKEEKISINSAMLKVIIEGIKAAPTLNGHVEYCHGLVKGKVTLMDHIDISTPILFGNGKMMTVNMKHMEDRSMRGIQALMNDYRQRLGNTDMDAVMFLAGLADSIDGLKRGRVLKTAGRLIGAGFGRGRVSISAGRLIDSIRKGKEGTCLTPDDIRQGSITISSVGPLYREWNGFTTMFQVVPPQICAMVIGSLQKKPAVENDEVVIKEIIPVTIVIDHRAVDFNDIVPLMKCMDEMLSSEELIKTLI